MSRRACLAAFFSYLLLGTSLAHAYDVSSSPVVAQGTLQAAFSPWDNVEGLIVDAIGGAKKQVLVQAYLLTSKQIAAVLIAAQHRGIAVKVLADADQVAKVELSKVPDLVAAGIPVWLETRYQNAHNKVILIDPGSAAATVITGSYNFTWSAQHKNAENILIVRQNPSLALRYLANWERHRQDAVPYQK